MRSIRLLVVLVLGWACCSSRAAVISSPTIVSNTIRFSFECAANQMIVVQSSSALTGVWSEVARYTELDSSVIFSMPLTNTAKLFRLEVNQAGCCAEPALQLDTLTLKAGEPVMVMLSATGGAGPLTWSTGGQLPPGLTLSEDGTLSGTPTADAAEFNESGRYAVPVRVVDGSTSSRQATASLDILVRLSYLRNIQATRTNGPSLKLNCSICHSADFKPDIQSDATALINVLSGSGAECGTDRAYIAPPDASDSLIYEKVSARNPCGERMPFAGDYLREIQVERLARWIRELTPEDID